MSDSLYQHIVGELLRDNEDVIEGQMMSSPGLKCRNKVFAFFYPKKRQMGFRLGPDFVPDVFGLKTAEPLAPFRTRPPLKGWFMVHEHEQHHWKSLSELALAFTRGH